MSLWCRACPDTAAVSAPPPVELELARALGGSVRAGPPTPTLPPLRGERGPGRWTASAPRQSGRSTASPPLEPRRSTASAARGPRRWTASAALVLVAACGAVYAESKMGDGRTGERLASLAIPGQVPPGQEPARPGGRVSSLGVMLDGEPIEDRFPTLATWVHPVLGTGEPLPATRARRFGAERPGKRPPECGGGHCGVDLSGERGTPVVAVAPGEILQVHGASSGRGGRYVRVRHPDDTVSSYFHLDEVAADLVAGQEIEAGRRLGTLGSSGVKVSGPHLHFGIGYADGTRTIHLDPVPFLRRAVILPVHQHDDAQRQAAAQD